jgi:predicted DNA binding protein/PAS domain-containing protein
LNTRTLKQTHGSDRSSRRITVNTDPDPDANRGLVHQSLGDDPKTLEAVLETTGVGVVLSGPDSTVEYIDERVERFFGLSRDVAIGSKRDRFLDSVVADRLVCRNEFPAPESDGDRTTVRVSGGVDRMGRWVRHDSVPLREGQLAGGQLDLFVEASAANSRERFERYEAVAGNEDDTVLVVDDGRSIEYANEGTQGTQAFAPSTVEGCSVLDVVEDVLADGADIQEFETALAATVDAEDQQHHSAELQLALPSGQRTHSFECSTLPTDDGPKVVVTVRNVETERRPGRELEESRNRYRTLIENFPNGTVTLVDEELRYAIVGGTPMEEAEATVAELEGNKLADVLPPELADALIPRYADALDGKESCFTKTIRDREFCIRVVPVRNDEGRVFAAMGVSRDVTERNRQERELEKRRRLMKELHRATRESNTPTAVAEIPENAVRFLETAFNFEYVSVKRYDDEEGVLRAAARSSAAGNAAGLGVISPQDDPIWEVYRAGESRVLEGPVDRWGDVAESPVNQTLVVPIGNFGVVVAVRTGSDEFDDVDVDLTEVVAANAKSAFERIHSDRMRGEVNHELTTQRERVEELSSIIDTIQTVRQRLASSETREALESGVCETLVRTKHVDLAWVGRPRGDDTDIAPVEWAGDGDGYLESVGSDATDELIPAQRAANDRELYSVPDVSARVIESPWAKEALSCGFRSVTSIPLVYEDVLYGVLTVFSRTQDAFGQTYEYLLEDIASLLMNYSRVLEHRHSGSHQVYTELEFEVADATYPLHQLGTETDATLRYETTIEDTDAEVRCLVTVEEGSLERVLERAAAVTSIVDAEQFGGDETDRVFLIVKKPFLASEVEKHGGRLVESVSDGTVTELRITLPRTVSNRPLLDSIATRYGAADLVAQRTTTASVLADPSRSVDRLTDRQYEVLNAAYHGGYYETPREVTGEELAESFGISNPAIYSHLQAAHRKLLEDALGADSNVRE